MKLNIFIEEYISKLKNLLENIDTKIMGKIVNSLENTIRNQSRIYILRNGGNAATASHMTNDLKVGLRRKDILNVDILYGLVEDMHMILVHILYSYYIQKGDNKNG